MTGPSGSQWQTGLMTSTKPRGWDGTPPGLADQAEDTDTAPGKGQLMKRAKELDIAGRSSMSKEELEAAIIEAEAE